MFLAFSFPVVVTVTASVTLTSIGGEIVIFSEDLTNRTSARFKDYEIRICTGVRRKYLFSNVLMHVDHFTSLLSDPFSFVSHGTSVHNYLFLAHLVQGLRPAIAVRYPF